MRQKKSPSQGPLSRRQWLTTAGLSLSGLALGSKLEAQAPPPRSPDWIRTGHIGLGARGRQLLRAAGEGAVAVCDLHEDRLRQGAAMAPTGIRGYRDYRALLDDRDVQAVVIATPAHWHAILAIHALEAGKDVYIAAPVCLRFGEGEEILRAARSFGGVCGTGHEDAIWNLDAQASSDTYYMRAPIHPVPAEDGEIEAPAWWDDWLGPAGHRHYSTAQEEGAHRNHPDFGLGQLGLTGAQFFFALMAAAHLPDTGMVSVEASPMAFAPQGFLAPALECRWQFANQAVYWEQPTLGGNRCALADRPAGASLWSGSFTETVEHTSLSAWLSRVRDRNTTLVPLTRAIRAATLAQAAVLAAQLGTAIQLPANDLVTTADPMLRSRMWQPDYAAYRFAWEASHGI